jgi:adenylate cyclase
MPSNSNNSKPHQAAQEQADLPPPAAASELDIALLLPKEQRVVLVCDVVESVRWMEHDEDNAIARWSQFAQHVRENLAPTHDGRVVKSTGDGLMIEFKQAPHAVAAAHALHTLAQEGNQRLAAQSPERQLHLRVGIHQAEVRRDAHDLYGHGVNLAARITTLAGPGEIIVTPEVRDHLTDQLDGQIEDMGECYLKHLQEPQRVYRVGATGQAAWWLPTTKEESDFRSSIAVIPFHNNGRNTEDFTYGELIADGINGPLSRSRQLHLISRLSCRALMSRVDYQSLSISHLKADHVLTGSYAIISGQILINAELLETKSQRVIWSGRVKGELLDLFERESALCGEIVSQAHAALLKSEVNKAITRPLPTLSSYTLFLGALTLMHRANRRDFQVAHDALMRLIDLHGRHCLPKAWIGKWYVLKVAQGWSNTPEKDAQIALDYCAKALDQNSNSALAIAVMGQVHGYLKQDLQTAERFYQQALQADPNESLAWLWSGMGAAFQGPSKPSLEMTEKAMALSPLDPVAYYYKSLSASAAIAAGDYSRAIELAQDSIRLNFTHSSTYRALAIAQVFAGRKEDAHNTVRQLLQLEPNFNVQAFSRRYPGRELAPQYTQQLAEALATAGLPLS